MDGNTTDKIGEWADTINNLLGATQLPMPAQFHLEQITLAMALMRDEMRAVYAEATGENPWEGHP